MIQEYILLSIVDRIDKLTNSIKEKYNFELKCVNNQQQPPFYEGFTKKRYLPFLELRESMCSLVKRLKLAEIMKKPLDKGMTFIGREIEEIGHLHMINSLESL
jgi:hypothetical protein